MGDFMSLDWDKLRIFHAAAEAGSFTHAADKLHLSQSAISRQVQTLEAQLGVQLFQRRIRALLLTDEGQRYFKAVRAALDDLRAATLSVRAGKSSAALTVATTVSFASLWLVPRLARFQSSHPGIQVRLVADNRIQDLERDRIDVAVPEHIDVERPAQQRGGSHERTSCPYQGRRDAAGRRLRDRHRGWHHVRPGGEWRTLRRTRS